MPIKIHHGPPGSYKTSGALGDDFLREAKEGRLVVTNVRGMSRERVLEHFADIPESFDLIFLDDRTEEGRKKLHTWFHWLPEGAYLFVDEAQDIWPRWWRDSDLSKLDYPGGREKAAQDNRPLDWAMAWDKHRHWNWDLVLTTPNIKKVRDDIRGVADAAYKHKNLMLLGFGGRYVEGFHAPDDAGTSESHFYSINRKKVPAYVWNLYDSTATGKVSDTKNGINLLSNPRILLLLGALVIGCFFALRGGGTVLGAGASGSGSAQPAASGVPQNGIASPAGGAGSPVRPAAPNRGAAGVVAHGKSHRDAADLAVPYVDLDPVVMGTSEWRGKKRYYIDAGDAMLTSDDYLKAGYTMTEMGPCAVKFQIQGFTQIVRCGREPMPRGERISIAKARAVGAAEEPMRRGEAGGVASVPAASEAATMEGGGPSTNPRFNVAMRPQ